MYTVGNIIYGVPINDRLRTFISDCNEHLTEDEYGDLFDDEGQIRGFANLYHGGCSEIVGYCGVGLGAIDEIDDVLISELPQPGDEHIRQVNEMIEALPNVVKTLIPEVGHYIVWSSS